MGTCLITGKPLPPVNFPLLPPLLKLPAPYAGLPEVLSPPEKINSSVMSLYYRNHFTRFCFPFYLFSGLYKSPLAEPIRVEGIHTTGYCPAPRRYRLRHCYHHLSIMQARHDTSILGLGDQSPHQCSGTLPSASDERTSSVEF
jgi:hypothetical protein